MTKVTGSTVRDGWDSQVVKGEVCEKWNRRPNFTDNWGDILETSGGVTSCKTPR